MLTNKEKEILEIIKNDPLTDQNRIADLLNISRSTVAVHISSLQKKGYLLGKGYVVKGKEDYVVGIGAALLDIYGKSRIAIRTHYDHPADIESTFGGVMHNIITDYVLLGGKAKLITAYGDDSFGKGIIEECNNRHIDFSDSLLVKGASSGIFMQIMDENNDMYMALCDMSVLDQLDSDFITSKRDVLLNAKAVVFDTSLSEKAIRKIIDICKGHTLLIADPISDNLAVKLKPFIKDLDLLKANKGELESIAGMKIAQKSDVEKAAGKLLKAGLKKIAASLGKDGILYMDESHSFFRKFKEEKRMANASGAGDAMTAAFIYGLVNEIEIEKTIDLGLAAGIAAIRSDKTINDEMSIELLERIIEENRK